jgi:hypothetical protein
MAKPKFVVQHFLVCQDAPWLGVAGPRTLRILEGVGYTYRVPSDAECPEWEFWVYLRLFLLNEVSGSRKFWIEVEWLDAPEGERRIASQHLGRIPFRADSPVTEQAFRLNRLVFPARGRYAFRLKYRRRSSLFEWQDVTAKSDYIRIE